MMLMPLNHYYSSKQENKPPANRRRKKKLGELWDCHHDTEVGQCQDSVRILTRQVSSKQE